MKMRHEREVVVEKLNHMQIVNRVDRLFDGALVLLLVAIVVIAVATGDDVAAATLFAAYIAVWLLSLKLMDRFHRRGRRLWRNTFAVISLLWSVLGLVLKVPGILVLLIVALIRAGVAMRAPVVPQT